MISCFRNGNRIKCCVIIIVLLILLAIIIVIAIVIIIVIVIVIIFVIVWQHPCCKLQAKQTTTRQFLIFNVFFFSTLKTRKNVNAVASVAVVVAVGCPQK